MDLSTQRGRFRSQRGVYLLRALGAGAAKKYKFNLYLRGPYSPALASDYYAIGKDSPAALAAPVDYFRPLPRIPAAWGDVIREAYRRGDGFLERMATLHAVRVYNPPADATEEQVMALAKELKPGLKVDYQEARRFLRRHRLYP